MLCICCVNTIHILTNLFCKGHDSAPGLEIMLPKQQHLSVSGQAADPARQHSPVEYVYRRSHPLANVTAVEYVFPRSASEGLTISSAESLSFHAFWTEMQPQLFHISTAADSGTLLSAAAPMLRALPRRGAAMFMRSTPGCGILDAPSLAWAASQWPRLRKSPSDHLMVYVWYIHGISLVYPWYILPNSKSCLLSAIK
jgi:hypothetical protein